MRRVTALLAALLLAGCVSTTPSEASLTAAPPSPSDVAAVEPSATPTATESPTPTPALTPRPTTAPSPSTTPADSVAPSPSESSTPSRAPAPSGPTARSFWRAVRTGIAAGRGRLSIAVRGPISAELRFQASASATSIDGELLFVCRDGRAFDGQSGFSELSGRWTCGADALVEGYRTMGQPVDAWSDDLPLDRKIRESYDVLESGNWRWRYSAENAIFGRGPIKVMVVIDPASGRITSASRTDPLGKTTWKATYSASFPDITVP